VPLDELLDPDQAEAHLTPDRAMRKGVNSFGPEEKQYPSSLSSLSFPFFLCFLIE